MVDLTQTVEADLSAMDADQLLNHLIKVRTAITKLKATDKALLDRLDELAQAGKVDQGGFTHQGWQFSWSAGRKSWAYPDGVKAMEAQAKAAKEASEADGSAVATLGESFWTIKPPKS